jgi:hypothetical protein
VFAHVLLQEVTEGTEKLCWLSFFCSKNSVSNISVNAVDSSEAGGFLFLQSLFMYGDEMDRVRYQNRVVNCPYGKTVKRRYATQS